MNATKSVVQQNTWKPRAASADEFKKQASQEEEKQTYTYTVKSGDTLSRISTALDLHHGIKVSYTQIAAQNNIANPNLIHVGDQLTITYDPASKKAVKAKPVKRRARARRKQRAAVKKPVSQPKPQATSESYAYCSETEQSCGYYTDDFGDFDGQSVELFSDSYQCSTSEEVYEAPAYTPADGYYDTEANMSVMSTEDDPYVDLIPESSVDVGLDASLPAYNTDQPEVIVKIKTNPAQINQQDVRNALEDELNNAIGGGNYALALEIADLFINNCQDETGQLTGVNAYMRVAEDLSAQGELTQAQQVYSSLGTKVSGSKIEVPLYDILLSDADTANGGAKLYGNSSHIAPTPEGKANGEKPLNLGFAGLAKVVAQPVSKMARIKAKQCEFLSRSGIQDPFDLGKVKKYLLSLPKNDAIKELDEYYTAFYFHPNSNIKDDTAVGEIAAFPTTKYRQKPADCSMYAKMAQEILTPGLGTRALNFVTGKKAPYEFSNVFAFRVSHGVRRTDSSHQMMLIETDDQAYLLNNDEIVPLEGETTEAIRDNLASLLTDKGYDLTDENSLPLTEFLVLDTDVQLSQGHLQDTVKIAGAAAVKGGVASAASAASPNDSSQTEGLEAGS